MFDRLLVALLISSFLIFVVKRIVGRIALRRYEKLVITDDPSYSEKIRVESSKTVFGAQQYFWNNRTFQLMTVFLLSIVGIIAVNSVSENDTINKIISGVLLVFAISFVVIFPLVAASKMNKFIINLLKKKYGNILRLDVAYNNIKPNKNNVGEIIDDYNYSFLIEKYNCIYTNYYVRVVKERTIEDEKGVHHDYFYEDTNNYIKYTYRLGNINVNVLEKEEIKKIIEKLSEIKIMNVSIEDGNLCILKETVIKGLNKNDIAININDIELFYEQLVTKVIEENPREVL